MNVNRQRLDEAEREELSRLLPVPGEPVLFQARKNLLKDHLMREITPPSAVPAAPVSWLRRRWTLAAIPVAAAAVATVVVVGSTGGSGGSGKAAEAAGPAVATTVTVQAGSSQGVAGLMDRIADVAAAKPVPSIGADQYEYIKSKVAWTRPVAQKTIGGKAVLDKVHQREVWLPQDPAKEGLIIENGKHVSLGGGDATERLDGGNAQSVSAGNNTYEQLASLPTDPDALLARIYAVTKGQAPGKDGAAFNWIGDQLGEAIAPPKVTAAMWRAAARIPGVEIISNSVDAAGRQGKAVARDDDGERTEWIFDKKNLNYLGERSYLIKDTPMGKAGMLTGTTAVLGRAVVDKIGQTGDQGA